MKSRDAGAPSADENSSIAGVIGGMSAVLACLAVVLATQHDRLQVGLTSAILGLMALMVLAMGILIGIQRRGRG